MDRWRDKIDEIPDDLEIREDAVPAAAQPAAEMSTGQVAPFSAGEPATEMPTGQVEPVSADKPAGEQDGQMRGVADGIKLMAEDLPALVMAILDELKRINETLKELID